ncbi:MAG: hypothetical protein ABR569_04615 [Gaiellaceae bacterium]
MHLRRRGALAGAVSAALWQFTDPLFKRAFGTPYSDSELLSAFVTRGRLQPAVGLALHASVGAGFGYAFVRLGGRGPGAGVVAAVAENVVLWPGMVVFDRVHPNRRDGTWPRLTTNPRVFAQATAAHALFGALLGVFARA